MRSDARKFWLKVVAFVMANAVGIVVAVAAANAVGERNSFGVGQTGSVMRFMPTDTHFDVLIAGPSHAYEFAWGGNQQVTEANLGASVMNIGNDGAGPMVESIYYDLFRARGNTADTIVLVAHPFVLFSRKFNEANRFTGREPIRADLLRALLQEDLSIEELFFYFQSKMAADYWRDIELPSGAQQCTAEDPARPDGCDEVDPEVQAKTNRNLYPDGVDMAAFEKYMAEFDALVRQMREDGSRVVIVVPPVLLPVDGLDVAMQRYEALAESDPGVEVYDFHDLYDDPSMFQHDLSHLNVTGVDTFTRDILRPIIDGAQSPSDVGT